MNHISIGKGCISRPFQDLRGLSRGHKAEWQKLKILEGYQKIDPSPSNSKQVDDHHTLSICMYIKTFQKIFSVFGGNVA
jgi:hypothetical protein